MNGERLRIRLAKMMDFHLGQVLASLAIVLRVIDRSKSEARPVRKILFIKFWGMGSIILSEPALRHLKEEYPQAEIHYLTLEQNRDLFRLIPSVRTVHCVGFTSLSRFLSASLRLVRELRRERYNLIFDAEFFVNFSALLACCVRADRIIGFAQGNGIKRHLLDVTVPFDEQLHTSRQFRRLVEKETRAEESDMPPRIFLPPDMGSNGDRSISNERPYVVMNVNASPLAIERRWPRERFYQLAKALLQTYDFDLILVGSSNEENYVAPLEKELDCPQRVFNRAGKLSLLELAELIKGAVLLISNDSGPIQMGAAFDIPVIGFYGPETPSRYGPLSSRKLVFYRGLWCSPCMSLNNAKTVHCINHLACMKGIQAEEVIPRVFNFIEEEVLNETVRAHGRAPRAGLL